jgi:hypothetical protein
MEREGDRGVKRKERRIMIDVDPRNADWTKRTWDIHTANTPELAEAYKNTPAYKYAVRGVPGRKDKEDRKDKEEKS